MILEMGRVAAVRLGDGLDVVRPAPPGLEDVPSNLSAADIHDVRVAAGNDRVSSGLEKLLRSVSCCLAIAAFLADRAVGSHRREPDLVYQLVSQ